MDVKKYIDFSREYIKKAVEYGKSSLTSVVNSAKSIIKSVISILNNLQSYVIRGKDPKTQAFKTTISALLVSAGVVYAGFQAKKVIAPSEDSAQKSTQLSEEQTEDGKSASEKFSILSSDNDNKDKQCKADNLPSYINISMTWGADGTAKSMVDDFKKLSPPSIIITAAGNAANDKPPKDLIPNNKKMASKEYDVIVVGSIDNHTNRSVFSQKGEEVAIVSPSDYMISTTSKHGYYQKFSGTSGATPLVTGALAGFTWLSVYQPTGAEAKVLLAKTAIPLRLSNEKPQMNGPGMLNAYKLGMVGKKLKELCGTDVYCFKNNILKDSTYEFPEDTGVLELVDQAFPECSADKCLQRGDSCQDMEETFNRLRKAALLNPSKKEYWRALSCIHASAGFADSAEGMINIYNGLLGADPSSDGIDRSCQVDEDCVFVPKCSHNFSKETMDYSSKEISFTPANKDYVPECQGLVLCDGLSSRREIKDSKGKTMRLRCVNSQCIEEEVQPEQEQSTGQR